MDQPCSVELMPFGSFRSDGPAGTYDLLYDAPDGRWLLAGPPQPGAAAGTLLAQTCDLDHALRLLLAASGRLGRFAVRLPCGRSFTRPGNVPAVEVLAALGYGETASITAFTVLERPDAATQGAVRRELVEALAGSPVGLGDVEATDSEAGTTYWTCDLSVPFEGMLRLAAADGIVDEALSGTGLVATGRAEAEQAAPATPNAALVLPLRRDRAA